MNRGRTVWLMCDVGMEAVDVSIYVHRHLWWRIGARMTLRVSRREMQGMCEQ